MLRIKDWFGRLGNSIAQLVNNIYVAKKYNLKMISPPHEIFGNVEFDFTNQNTDHNIKIVEYHYFADTEYLSEFPPKEDIKNILKTYIKPLIRYNKQNVELTDKDLVIHIRSGDAFYWKKECYNHNGMYAQPPLSFYEKILKEEKYDRIFLVAENYLNPVINILLKKYPTIIPIINKKPHILNMINDELINDLYYLMEAKNLVLSNGTFLYALSPLNDNLQKVYIPESQLHIEKQPILPLFKYDELMYYLNDNIELKYYIFPNYYEVTTDELRYEYLLLYEEEKIIKHIL
jgi:hypothetical protein